MRDGYHKVFSGHGVRGLERSQYIPDARLGIGSAENIGSIPVQFVVKPVASTKALLQSMQTDHTKGSIDGTPAELTPDLFPRTGYMGAWLGSGY